MGLEASFDVTGGVAIPGYLLRTYWWAYVHPLAVRVFERQWLVNLILRSSSRISRASYRVGVAVELVHGNSVSLPLETARYLYQTVTVTI